MALARPGEPDGPIAAGRHGEHADGPIATGRHGEPDGPIATGHRGEHPAGPAPGRYGDNADGSGSTERDGPVPGVTVPGEDAPPRRPMTATVLPPRGSWTDQPRSARVVDRPARGRVGAPFPPGDTDEWIMPGSDDEGSSASHLRPAASRSNEPTGAYGTPTTDRTTEASGAHPRASIADPLESPSGAIRRDLVRPGPVALAADSWDEVPATVGHADDYHGVRRARRPNGRLWLLIAAVVVVVGVAVSVPLVLTSQDQPERSGAQGPRSAVDTTGGPAPTTIDGQLVPPVSGGPTTTRPPRVDPSTSGVATDPTLSPSPTITPPPFAPPTLQAEDTSGLAGWQTVSLSGATCDPPTPDGTRAVRTGLWSWPPGTLTFANVTVPTAGAYSVLVSYSTNGPHTRTAQVTVNGVRIDDQSFTRTSGSNCLLTKPIAVNLVAGTNTIGFANPSSPGPVIDKIVVNSA